MLPLFSKPLEAVTCDDIQLLVSEAYPEDTTVEFKEKLPHRQGGEDPWYQGGAHSEYARNHLLEEVIAFANTYGGTLLLGIKETKERPARAAGIVPIPRCTELAERLRLQIRDCVDPQIPIVHAWGIVTDAQGQGVVMIRVPKSRLAPHRHTATLHCYIRRADRSEKMTMREIQDLTLQTERGTQHIDRLFAERRHAFHQWIPPRIMSPSGAHTISTPYALRVTLIPLEPLYTEKVFGNSKLFPFIDRLVLTVGPYKVGLELPPVRHERPILRGACRVGNPNSKHYMIHQELTCYGVGEIRLAFAHEENLPLDPGRILGAVANGLYMGEAFRQGVGAPDVEYALEMELSRPEASLFLGTLRELSGSSFPSDTLGTVRPNPCLFPRLSVGSAAEFGKIMQIVTNDLWNAAGTEGIEEEFALGTQ